MTDAPPDIVALLHRLLTHRLTRYAVCWLACLGLSVARWHHARHMFDSPRSHPDMSAAELDRVREDGNNGHTWIDFGGQYVFGRTAAEGRWRDLYDRDALRRTADRVYPLERQSPAVQKYSAIPNRRPPDLSVDDVRTDADQLLRSMIGDDVEDERNRRIAPGALAVALSGGGGNPFASAVGRLRAEEQTAEEIGRHRVLGGPLYPPVHALLYAPLGMIENAQLAYFLFQLFSIVCVFGCGLAVRALSRGRIWWPVATTLLLLFPGMRPGLDLGQNNAVTLFVVLVGWAVAARGWRFGGGLVWGLLAFKPVWGLAFILAPILLRQWRFVFGVGVCGCSLVAVSALLVGVEGWVEWFQVGQQASGLYNVDENWINLSRDVSGLPKRLFIDFSVSRAERATSWVNLVSNLLLASIALTTVAVGLFGGLGRRVRRVARQLDWFAATAYVVRGYGMKLTGLRAGFVLLGGYLCCYRFMYYDALLASVGFAALLAFPNWTLSGFRGELRTAGQPASRRRVFLYVNSAALTLFALLLLADNVFLNTGGAVTIANDNWQRVVTDPCGGTQTAKAADGTTVTEPKKKSVPRQLSLRLDYNHAIDTYLVLFTWLWCGWRLLRDGERRGEYGPAAVGRSP